MPAQNSPMTGSGEPSQTLALLWGVPTAERRRKGPNRSLSVATIIDAALSLADEEGIIAVTMRGVAERVGLSAMSVYTYVPGKAELLDLMVDALYLRMPRPAWHRSPWRSRLTRVADDNRTLLAEHPWLTEIATLSRPPLGPGTLNKYEHELAAFDGTGLSDLDIDAALTYLLGFVQSHMRAAHDAQRATTDTAMSDQQWWDANESVLRNAFDPEAFPRATRIGSAAGQAQGAAWSADSAWRFGLDRTLDGLSALIDDR